MTFMTQNQFLSSSSVLLCFLPFEVSDKKNLGWMHMGRITAKIIWLHPLNNIEILLVFRKLDKYKKLVI